MRVMIINGPNINMLGVRERKIYGDKTMGYIYKLIRKCFPKQRRNILFYQSNHEGRIVDRIQRAKGLIDWIIINPAAFSYSGLSILDAMKSIDICYGEIHISNIFGRVGREKSIFSQNAVFTIAGMGYMGYIYALSYIYHGKKKIQNNETTKKAQKKKACMK
ncbi:type II 3-dehydroquinate dehydratase [Candidatus Vidania fulgoroideorum]